ncbi:hypothetical protein EIN_344770 [Entamoeba invadens IP1]|uniref:Uncharacterized protein n=1 Tax=Entamoeba invadens IP1 TaxID=370355 RepID=A0A0A1U391_ENTIV|nr:hypothetical protein EIN_344770 [Entamoeba invadens IP1]ELP88517.1 hypothetical protein EIN_344770 [Entamoeba invadens IP1]|eukprot:XP_004255288.1 hypothetical protein EIN_344770 [Entamoeba invadens IP1]
MSSTLPPPDVNTNSTYNAPVVPSLMSVNQQVVTPQSDPLHQDVQGEQPPMPLPPQAPTYNPNTYQQNYTPTSYAGQQAPPYYMPQTYQTETAYMVPPQQHSTIYVDDSHKEKQPLFNEKDIEKAQKEAATFNLTLMFFILGFCIACFWLMAFVVSRKGKSVSTRWMGNFSLMIFTTEVLISFIFMCIYAF